jgi:uncharacterized GH25 family protein
MTRFLLAAATAAALAAAAAAHFVFVVPDQGGKGVTVVFSDTLDPDEAVSIDKIAGLTLTARSAGGKEVAVPLAKAAHSLVAPLGPAGPRLVYGSVVYGLMARKDARPTLLVYHPKAVVGGAVGADATVGGGCPLEVVPVTAGGTTRFRLLAAGQPVADADGSVARPDGTKEKVRTDADGYTAGFAGAGRFAVWLRRAEAKAGEHAGQTYEEVRHYATLVADLNAK